MHNECECQSYCITEMQRPVELIGPPSPILGLFCISMLPTSLRSVEQLRYHHIRWNECSPDRAWLKVIIWRYWLPIRTNGFLDIEGSEDRRDCNEYLHRAVSRESLT